MAIETPASIGPPMRKLRLVILGAYTGCKPLPLLACPTFDASRLAAGKAFTPITPIFGKIKWRKTILTRLKLIRIAGRLKLRSCRIWHGPANL